LCAPGRPSITGYWPVRVLRGALLATLTEAYESAGWDPI
jgi:hypothetical protein